MSQTQNGQGTAVATLGSVKVVHQLLEARADQFAGLLPTGVKPERFAKVVLQSVRSTPRLLTCTQASFLEAALQCAALGLEPARGQAYLIPYKNKMQGKVIAQFQLGWQGMLELAMRSGEYSTLEAHVVREGDEFRYARGLHPDLHHVPIGAAGEVAPLTHVYAIAWPSGAGLPVWEVMNRAQIDTIRSRSKAGNDGPWVTDYDEMARKTVFRRLAKWLRLTPEVAQAFDQDAVREYGKDAAAVLGTTVVQAVEDETVSAAQAAEAIEEELGEIEDAEPTATDNLVETLSAGQLAEREAEKARQLAYLQEKAKEGEGEAEFPPQEAQEAPETPSAPDPAPSPMENDSEAQEAAIGSEGIEVTGAEPTAVRTTQGVDDAFPVWVGEFPGIRHLPGTLKKIEEVDTVVDMWYRDTRKSSQDIYHARLLELGVEDPNRALEQRVRDATAAHLEGNGNGSEEEEDQEDLGF